MDKVGQGRDHFYSAIDKVAPHLRNVVEVPSTSLEVILNTFAPENLQGRPLTMWKVGFKRALREFINDCVSDGVFAWNNGVNE